MILNGKAKEEFEKWYFETKCSSSMKFEELLPHHINDVFGWLYNSSKIIQNAFIIEWFSSVKYEGSSSLWQYCFVTCYWDRGLKEYKQSTIQAIKKANDIYNARTN